MDVRQEGIGRTIHSPKVGWWEDSCMLFHSMCEPLVSCTPVLAQVKLRSSHTYHCFYFKLLTGWI